MTCDLLLSPMQESKSQHMVDSQLINFLWCHRATQFYGTDSSGLTFKTWVIWHLKSKLWNKVKMKLFTIAAFAAIAQAQVSTCGKYGCSKQMDTTGCSSQTGSQDGCGSGISCSRKMAENDNNRTRQHRFRFFTESFFKTILDPNSEELVQTNPLIIAS